MTSAETKRCFGNSSPIKFLFEYWCFEFCLFTSGTSEWNFHRRTLGRNSPYVHFQCIAVQAGKLSPMWFCLSVCKNEKGGGDGDIGHSETCTNVLFLVTFPISLFLLSVQIMTLSKPLLMLSKQPHPNEIKITALLPQNLRNAGTCSVLIRTLEKDLCNKLWNTSKTNHHSAVHWSGVTDQ